MSNQKIENDDDLEINGDNNVINITKGSSSNRLKKSKWKMVLNIGVPLATAGVGSAGGYGIEHIARINENQIQQKEIENMKEKTLQIKAETIANLMEQPNIDVKVISFLLKQLTKTNLEADNMANPSPTTNQTREVVQGIITQIKRFRDKGWMVVVEKLIKTLHNLGFDENGNPLNK